MKNFLATILIFFGSILHAEENPLGITFFGSFLHTGRVPNALFFFSDIQKNDGFELRRALRTHEIDTIVLASPGGSVWEGLNMAGMIFDKKMTAYVPPLPEGKGCYSACAYMFFAGQTRLAVGELGVHQIGAYDAGVDSEKRKVGETQQATQFTTSEVIGHLNEFGTPPWVYERMFRSREMYVFTEDEKQDLSQGLLDPSLRGSIDVFLGQLRSELEKAAKTEPKTSAAEGFDKTDREMVKALQVLLNEAKCSAGVADGVWGGQTNSAAERFAKANQLTYSGPASIGRQFLDSLTSNNKKNCAPIRHKTTIAPTAYTHNPYLSFTYNVALRCPGREQINFSIGKANLHFRGRNGRSKYWGSQYFNRQVASFTIYDKTKEPMLKIIGSFNANAQNANGITKQGCNFSVSRN